MESIGQRLKQVRNVAGMSQEAFATQFNKMSLSKYRRIESGSTPPDIDFLQSVLDRFPGTEPLWLLTGKVGGVDRELMRDIINKVENLLAKYNISEQQFDNNSKAKVIALLYDFFITKKQVGQIKVDTDTVNSFLSLAIDPIKTFSH